MSEAELAAYRTGYFDAIKALIVQMEKDRDRVVSKPK